MKRPENNNWLDDALTEALSAEKSEPNFEKWQQDNPEAIEMLTSRAGRESFSPNAPHHIRRIIMKSRITKIAAAAVILIVILVGLSRLDSSIDGAGVAFGDVLQKIQGRSYTFDLTVTTGDKTSTTVQGSVQEPSRMRFDGSVGSHKISSIVDRSKGKSLILFHQFKTCQIMDVTIPHRDEHVGGIFALYTKPVENLWNLRDGTEEELGQKEIDGQIAEGFRISQEDKYFRYDITIWADTKTAVPLLVEMLAKPLADSPGAMKWTMTNFDLDVELAEDLFSLQTPPGYTLAHQVGLNELDKGAKRSAEAEKIEQMLTLWTEGKKSKAVELLLAIDWMKNIKFSDKPYPFTLTEKEYVSLKPEDGRQIMTEVLATSRAIREIIREVLALGQNAMSVQDYERAERYFEPALQMGRLLMRNPDSMITVRMVGIAVERKALEKLISLYKATNQQKKLGAAEDEMQAMIAEMDKIKRKLSGK
jgi:outer membrane lipoprotein-sorting protein